MCYSYQSSIVSWLVASASSIYMLANPEQYYTWIPLFILTFTQIQIFEAVIWASMGANNGANQYVTALLPYLLLAQPLVNSYLGYKTTNEQVLKDLSYVFAIVIVVYYFMTKGSTYITTIGKNGRLVWNRYAGSSGTVAGSNVNVAFLGNGLIIILYLVGLFMPMFYIPDKTMRMIAILYTLGTLLFTMYSYKEEMSSMWCYMAVWISLLALIFNRKPHIIQQSEKNDPSN